MRIVIVGATSGIAERCARLWATRGPAAMVLVARDAPRVERVAADLRVRAPGAAVTTVVTDLRAAMDVRAIVDAIVADGSPDVVLIAHGALPDQPRCQSDTDAARDALDINGVSPVLFAEAFAAHLEQAGRGTLAIIGSVAGDRGRKSNYVYGAAKGLVGRYAQGLQHRFAKTGVRVVLVKPGPTDTPMTAHLKQAGARLADADAVAAAIVRAVARGTPVLYAPAKWWLIMQVIRHLPSRIFNRLDL